MLCMWEFLEEHTFYYNQVYFLQSESHAVEQAFVKTPGWGLTDNPSPRLRSYLLFIHIEMKSYHSLTIHVHLKC